MENLIMKSSEYCSSREVKAWHAISLKIKIYEYYIWHIFLIYLKKLIELILLYWAFVDGCEITDTKNF